MREDLLHCNELTQNVARLSTRWKEKPVNLSYTEFQMVYCLARHPGHIKSRQQLMEAADTVLDDSTITSHIRRIRNKFLDADPEFEAIETVYGLGYRWHPEP